ncbi:MAG: tetratricopeptide repeat protein [Spirochaetales bacterium]|nr:tetratricopeptide repeat protein [Spirochaetales bacterium]
MVGGKIQFLQLLIWLFVFVPSSVSSQTSALQLHEQGVQAIERGLFFEAIQYNQQAIGLNRNYAQAYGGLAEAYFYLNEYDEALTHVDQALVLDPRNQEFQNFRGRIFLALGNTTQAREIFSTILTRNPFNQSALLGQAELLLSTGNLTEAQQSLLNSLSIDPRDRRALLSLALLYQNQGNPQEAQRYIQRALDYYSDNKIVQYTAAKLFFDALDFTSAEYHLGIALELDADYFDALFLQSNLYIELGMYANALRPLERTLAIRPNSDLLWYTRGLVQYYLQRIPDAIMSLRRSLANNSENEIARIFLESIAIDSLEFEDPTRQDLANFRLAQARQLELQNRFDRSLQYLNRGLVLSPLDEELRRSRASIYLKTQQLPLYVEELSFLIEERGVEDKSLNDQLEVYRHLLSDSLSARLQVSQFDIEQDLQSIMIFAQQSVSTHPMAVRFLAQQTADSLLTYPRFTLRASEPGRGRYREPVMVNRLDEAFSQARQEGTDYFMILNIDEGTRRIGIVADLYLSRTGRLVRSIQVSRTGNSRVMEAILRVVGEVDALLPRTGTLLSRTLNSGLINLGSLDGIVGEQEFPILSRNNLLLKSQGLGYQVLDSEILGTFTVTEVDARIARGTLVSSRFFDSISIGDKVVFQAPQETGNTLDSPNFPEIYNQIRELR